MKKIMALLLGLVMALAMCMTAFAADTSLTINTTAGHTYKIYQILKGDVSGLSDGKGTLANVEVGSSVTDASATAEAIVNALMNKADGELGNAAYAYVKGGNEVATVTGTGSAVTTTLAEGYYVVTDEYTTTGSDSLSRYLVAVAGPTTMDPKTETPSIDKKIVDTDKNAAMDDNSKTDTAAIGDTIEYEITGSVPNYDGYTYYYYVVDDTLSKGLTLDADSFAVKVGDTTLTKGSDYYVYTTNNADGTTNFRLAFENIKNYTVDAAISIKYNATVNEDAVIGTDPNTNTAKLIYSNNPSQSDRGDKEGVPGEPGGNVPTGETPDYITKTYVTQIKLTKVDQDGNALNGAEFTLTGTNLTKVKFTTATNFTEAADGSYYKLKSGAYTETAPTDATADLYESTTTKYTKTTSTNVVEASGSGADANVKAFVGDDGILYFTGLDKGTYTLTETTTPTGFNTIDPINFEIKGTIDGATATVGGNITWSSDNQNLTWNEASQTFEITITNIAGKLLPSTGGIGTTIFYVAGTILVLGAAVLLITKKRMRRA